MVGAVVAYRYGLGVSRGPRTQPVDGAFVEIEGPWTHRHVSANGARFHVAELGEGPLVLALHGFPQFWYVWREQMVALADAGYRVVAMDLRGYGGSDKPPRGYDTYMGGLDAAAVVRALGDERAVVLGQGLGAWIAWTMPVLQPSVTRAVAALSCPHPRVVRSRLSDPRQRAALAWVAALQVPFRPERELTQGDAAVHGYLRDWAAPASFFPAATDVERYASALRIPFVAHSAAEHFRWLGRSLVRPDGPMFMRRIRHQVAVPVLEVGGTDDRCILAPHPASAAAAGPSAAYVRGAYRYAQVEGAGHFLTEESPAQVNALLLDWLSTLG